jgi:hypothetical protein
MGEDVGAKIVREQIIGALLNRTKLVVVASKDQADAVVHGSAIGAWGDEYSSVGSANARSAHVAAAGGTVAVRQLGANLTDLAGNILWAFDDSKCKDYTRTILARLPPAKKSISVCAAEQLTRAIDKDMKAAERR